MFELGDRAEDLEEHPPDRGGGVDALVEHHQIHPGGLQLVRQLDEVLQGAAEPVELGDHQLVPRPQRPQRLVELGPAGELPGGDVGEDPLAAGAGESVGLGVGVLVAGRHPRVADPHAEECIANEGVRDVGSDTSLVTTPTCGNPQCRECLVNDRFRTSAGAR